MNPTDDGSGRNRSGPVRYDERDGVAVITLNRPDKLNTLTDAVIGGVADGIDAATKSPEVSSVILRGATGTPSAGYDWAIGGATDLVLCCDLLYMASDAHIGYAPVVSSALRPRCCGSTDSGLITPSSSC